MGLIWYRGLRRLFAGVGQGLFQPGQVLVAGFVVALQQVAGLVELDFLAGSSSWVISPQRAAGAPKWMPQYHSLLPLVLRVMAPNIGQPCAAQLQ